MTPAKPEPFYPLMLRAAKDVGFSIQEHKYTPQKSVFFRLCKLTGVPKTDIELWNVTPNDEYDEPMYSNIQDIHDLLSGMQFEPSTGDIVVSIYAKKFATLACNKIDRQYCLSPDELRNVDFHRGSIYNPLYNNDWHCSDYVVAQILSGISYVDEWLEQFKAWTKHLRDEHDRELVKASDDTRKEFNKELDSVYSEGDRAPDVTVTPYDQDLITSFKNLVSETVFGIIGGIIGLAIGYGVLTALIFVLVQIFD